jgi:hypothetical protein
MSRRHNSHVRHMHCLSLPHLLHVLLATCCCHAATPPAAAQTQRQVVARRQGSPLTFDTIEEFSLATFTTMARFEGSADVRQVRALCVCVCWCVHARVRACACACAWCSLQPAGGQGHADRCQPPTLPASVNSTLAHKVPHTTTQLNSTQHNTTQHNTTQHNTHPHALRRLWRCCCRALRATCPPASARRCCLASSRASHTTRTGMCALQCRSCSYTCWRHQHATPQARPPPPAAAAAAVSLGGSTAHSSQHPQSWQRQRLLLLGTTASRAAAAAAAAALGPRAAAAVHAALPAPAAATAAEVSAAACTS